MTASVVLIALLLVSLLLNIMLGLMIRKSTNRMKQMRKNSERKQKSHDSGGGTKSSNV